MFNSADVFTSRRTHFNECMYWCRNEEDIEREIDLTTMVYVDHDLNELFYERSPNGAFMAVETASYDDSNQIIGGTMMFDQSFVTIFTNDYIDDLKVNDIVYFDDKVWRVTNISRTKRKRQNQFSKDVAYKTYIQLKG